MRLTYNDQKPSVHESAFIAPNATLIGNVSIGQFSSVWFGCVLRADINSIAIGANSNIQDGCLLHVTDRYPVSIGDRVTCGHGAIIHGCTIESDCLIAMGAIILDGAVIGSGSIIGAGSVVAPGTIVAAGSLVLGTPGKVVRQVQSKDHEKIELGWQNYRRYSEIYRNQVSELGPP